MQLLIELPFGDKFNADRRMRSAKGTRRAHFRVRDFSFTSSTSGQLPGLDRDNL